MIKLIKNIWEWVTNKPEAAIALLALIVSVWHGVEMIKNNRVMKKHNILSTSPINRLVVTAAPAHRTTNNHP